MSNLILPRVRVTWGGTNLSSYTGEGMSGEPLVYDVSVDLASENEGPSAEMKWNPTGPGFAVYEQLVQSKMNDKIIIEYFFSGGKSISLAFVWSGQSINYGNDMTITVKMISELAGKVNGSIRNTAQAYDKGGADPQTILNKSVEQYGADSSIFKYNPGTLAAWSKVKFSNMYGQDWTLGNNAAQIAKQTGDIATATNIGGEASIVFFPPYSWPKTTPNTVTMATASSPSSNDVTSRVGYFLGPGIIDSLTRTSIWKPPQQDNKNVPGKQPYAIDPQTGQASSQNPKSVPDKNVSDSNKATSAPLGTANNRASLSLQSKENPDGPTRSKALNDEKGATLQCSAFMCPVLCGIKPNDIVFVPSLTGKYMEDWIVQSVNYKQNNGKVTVDINASRVYGLGTPMNPTAAAQAEAQAKAKGLTGPTATPENWEKYAWEM